MFRLPLFACLFLLGSAARSQTVFRLDSLPTTGLVLDKGWTWHLGDNPAWAKPEFNDSRWDTLNPTQPVFRLQPLPVQGMGWLRLHLRVSPAWRGRVVFLYIQQSGATDLFLNGKMVLRNGQIGTLKNIEVGSVWQYKPAIILGADSLQTIAVRYAFSRKQWLRQRDIFAFFRLSTMTPEASEKQQLERDTQGLVEFVLFGVFIVLGILQLLLYAAATHQRPALSLGLFLVTQSLVHLFSGIGTLSTPFFAFFGVAGDVHFFDYLYVGFITAATISSFYYLLGIYQYFKQPRQTLFFVAAGITFSAIPSALLLPYLPYGFLAQFIPTIIVPFADILRVGLLAIKRAQPGAKLFTLTHGVTLLVFMGWTLSVFLPMISDFLVKNGLYLFSISFLGSALAISLLLAQERSTINALLRRQLVALEALSQQTIAQEQEKRHLLATQNERLEDEVRARTGELNHSLTELRATQTQLIQKEKLASLGELTAGIAHEIQNPLNFVNNFSEVSQELVSELRQEETKTNRDAQLIDELLTDLNQNLQKIHHHGGRASSIVKGMLEHSRTDSGEKRPTNLNALTNEYLQIAYHGFRAKDKSFECTLVTSFDAGLGEVEVSPQEIGRVLLNLLNNAFYAVRGHQLQADTTYQPTVRAITATTKEGVRIQVADNGMGMSENVQHKIFQPFFTTKPTGEGTGLGLSLSYDIVTKGHGGSLTVESQVGVGSVFTIYLPQLIY